MLLSYVDPPHSFLTYVGLGSVESNHQQACIILSTYMFSFLQHHHIDSCFKDIKKHTCVGIAISLLPSYVASLMRRCHFSSSPVAASSFFGRS